LLTETAEPVKVAERSAALIVIGLWAMVMVNEPVVAVAVLLSVTRMVMAEEPAAVGVPEMVPAELKERPEGSEPEKSVKALFPDPPDALRVSEKEVP
jgi:hypothetical protein